MNNILLQAMLVFMKVGLFSFGGGYAVMAMIQKEVVEIHGWLTAEEFFDIIAITEMTPGPIAVNSSTFTGYMLLGAWGGILLTLCVCFLPFFLSLIAAMYFDKFKENKITQGILNGIRPVTIGLLCSILFTLVKASVSGIYSIIILIVAGFIRWKYEAPPLVLIGVSGALGIVFYKVLPLLLA